MKKKNASISKKLKDWEAKSAYLNKNYSAIAPYDFYESLGLDDLPECFKICAVHANAQKGQRMQKYLDIMDMLVASGGRRDAYVYPAVYYKNYAKENLMHLLPCIYIDLDYVKAADLRLLCQQDFYGFRPTYLVNSGNGVHLVYLLSEAVNTYDWTKEILKNLHSALLQVFASRKFKADTGTGISHSYRIVGSQTKLGKSCTAYQVGGKVSIEALADSLGIVWQRPQYMERDYEKRPSDAAPHGHSGFYTYLTNLIPLRSKEGHRYNSIFALACVGCKCNIPFEQLSKDAMAIARKLGLPLKEAKHALEVCDPEKAKTVRAATLEAWLGWSFDRKTKRNGRTQAEHLALIAESKTSASRKEVWDHLRKHGFTSIKAIAETLHKTRKTVAKYYHQWLDALKEGTVDLIDPPVKATVTVIKEAAQTATLFIHQAGEPFIAYIPALGIELCSEGTERKEKREKSERRVSRGEPYLST
ncbi:hypothetical protein [Mitsuokella sp.]|uniref:hypothetical protein n=1 Tax=Mitsuokella sp. TaxID=2049034 RepID=UPI003D7EB360